MTAFATVIGMTPALRQLVAICDTETRDVIAQVLHARGSGHVEMLDGGAAAAARFIAATVPPRLLIVDLSDSADPLVALDELAALCPTDTRVIALGTANDIGLYRAMHALGVSEYLVKPVSAAVLAAALDAALATAAATASATARTVALIGARGGAGTSALALSAAWLLARVQRVTLLDLDIQFGTTALGLDVPPVNGLADLLANPDRVDALLVAAATVQHGERLMVLAGEAPLERDAGNIDGLPALLAALTASTDAVIIDLPRRVDAMTRLVLRTADQIGIVTDLTLAGLRDTQRLLALTQGLRAGARPLIIANRTDTTQRAQLPRAEFERGIGGKLDVWIAEDPAMAAAAATSATPLAAQAGRQRAAFAMLAALLGATEIAVPKSHWWQR